MRVHATFHTALIPSLYVSSNFKFHFIRLQFQETYNQMAFFNPQREDQSSPSLARERLTSFPFVVAYIGDSSSCRT